MMQIKNNECIVKEKKTGRLKSKSTRASRFLDRHDERVLGWKAK